MGIPYKIDMSAVALVSDVRCPICRGTITSLSTVTADLPPGPIEPVSLIDPNQVLGWATSCGCLISAVTYSLYFTMKSGNEEITAMRFVRNPVTRDQLSHTTAPRGLRGVTRDRHVT